MPSINTSQRVAVITGCSEPSSLGTAFARELLGRGWTVFATARNLSKLQHLKDSGAELLELEVTSDESVAAAAKTVSTLTGGRVDLVINNAGVAGPSPVLQTDPAKLAAMHDIHVLGPLRVTQAFYPYLSQTATPDVRAKIVNIGSVISHGLPWYAAYATTKAGVQVLSDVMRREFAPFNIDVITVELALVQTAMTAGTKGFDLALQGAEPFANASAALEKSSREFAQQTAKAPRPDQVAKAVIDAVEKPRSPPKLWLGRNNFLFHWIIPYLPVSVADSMSSKQMNVALAAS